MKKYLWIGLLLGLSSMSWAQTEAEKNLLSAQIQYQNALKAQDAAKTRVSVAENRLKTANGRMHDAQRELTSAQEEHAAAAAQQAQANSDFEAAGRNLDQAWGIK